MAQQTAIELLLSKIPDAAEIKAFISNNDADEKMLNEWLWERIYKGVDYKQMEKEQILELIKLASQLTGVATVDEEIAKMEYIDVYNQYYKETYNK